MASASGPKPGSGPRPVAYVARLADAEDPAQALLGVMLDTSADAVLWAYAKLNGRMAALSFADAAEARLASWLCAKLKP